MTASISEWDEFFTMVFDSLLGWDPQPQPLKPHRHPIDFSGCQ
jgi:hypothetical protein